jgi:hypothetical protein
VIAGAGVVLVVAALAVAVVRSGSDMRPEEDFHRAAPPGPDGEPAPIAGAGYERAFADEFDGMALDPLWASAPFGGSLPGEVGDGRLTLRATAANDYVWGHLASTGPRQEAAEPSYPDARAWEQGYFEARVRYTDSPWSWPAFWLFSMSKSEAWEPQYDGEDCRLLNSEWDIMENGVENQDGDRPASSWYFTALHRNTTDNTRDGYCGVTDAQRTYHRHFRDTDLSDWHTWGGLWTRDEFCTYLDGVELQCMDPYDSARQPMHLTFTMQYLGRCDGCGERPDELALEVDWVRVWQRPGEGTAVSPASPLPVAGPPATAPDSGTN